MNKGKRQTGRLMKGRKYEFYVVYKGRQPGIYTTWDACQVQVDGFSGCSYRGFESWGEALHAWVTHCKDPTGSVSRIDLPYEHMLGVHEATPGSSWRTYDLSRQMDALKLQSHSNLEDGEELSTDKNYSGTLA